MRNVEIVMIEGFGEGWSDDKMRLKEGIFNGYK